MEELSVISLAVGAFSIATGAVWLILVAREGLRLRPFEAETEVNAFSMFTRLPRVLTHLARELGNHPRPLRLIFLGILLLLVGVRLADPSMTREPIPRQQT